MRYRIEQTERALSIQQFRAPAIRRTAVLLSACAIWCALAYVVIEHLLSPGEDPLLWGLMGVPLLAVPALERSVSAALWPDRRVFARQGDLISMGRRGFARSQVHALRLHLHPRRSRLELVVAPNPELELELSIADFDDRLEAEAVAERLASYLAVPLSTS